MRGSLTIVGAGRVGRALGRRLRELGWKIGAVVTQSEASARKAVRYIGAGEPHGALARPILRCSVFLITTPDAAVREVAKQLARIGAEELNRKIVLHTSGALNSGVLDAVRAFGAAAGSMHPLQSFSGVGVPPLEGKVFAIEGDAAAVRMARQLARSLGGAPVRIDGSQKLLYHAAATMAAAHVLVVEEAATQLLMSIGMNRREAVRALLPLTRQVLQNFERLGPRAAWTGPLSRGDYEVVAGHQGALRQFNAEFAGAYEVLNSLAARVLSPDTREEQEDLRTSTENKRMKAKATGGRV
jgi:predicted short-subunit dehydrogenase-like oxidoreductase (DUF2520 family)